ncbi:hypothetical protein [Achromobacter insuavis]|uniref:hypothetical protein n=1 Tax=Achromobacter insuavis TaxID=1287735 RepID=UPI001F12EEA6|nr:hypothetical protein [Achromobacter insuavis]
MSSFGNQEIDQTLLTRDTRSVERKMLDWLYRPSNFRLLMVLLVAAQLWIPAIWPLWIVVVWVLGMVFQDQKFRMPLRMPKDLGGLDRSDYIDERFLEKVFWGLSRRSRLMRKLLPAAGILYLGYLRTPDHDQIMRAYHHGRELWLTNSDCRTHAWVSGTTGSGKTEALIGIADNALCWGSGVCYGDGKGDSSLAFSLWSICRRRAREDDFLTLNFLTGGRDPFEAMVARENGQWSGKTTPLAPSNSLNSFAEGSADFLLQLLSSLQPPASGDGAQWQMKALNMIDAELRTLCYKRAKGELDTSIKTIREYLSLQNLVKFYLEGVDGKLPELAFLPIKAYFETGLPGFNPALANSPTEWAPEVFNQHGYLTGQFARTLSMMMDTYGYIFEDQYPEIDLADVLLNNRFLVVMVPSLEKSAAEAAACGKLYSSDIRLTMAQNLGHTIEGTREQVLDSKATNSPFPKVIINDEISYWYAQGNAVMFAQARSLGFMMLAAAQDLQGLDRGEAKEEVGSLIANTKVKYTLALEDPDKTFSMVQKTAGEGYFSVLAGFDESNPTVGTQSFKAQRVANVQKRARLELKDVQNLQPGEGFISFKGSLVPSAAYWLTDDEKKTKKLAARINRFLQIERPTLKKMPANAKRVRGVDQQGVKYITAEINRGQRPYYPPLTDPILDAVRAAAKHMTLADRVEVAPVERGIVLFEAARRAMHAARAAGATGFLHEARRDDPAEIMPGEDDNIPDYAYEE